MADRPVAREPEAVKGSQGRNYLAPALAGLMAASCGGGGGGGSPMPPVTPVPLVRVSQASTFTTGCNGAAQTGTVFVNAEVEPSVAVNPANAAQLIGAWQQDRWSNGGSQGLVLGASSDGGQSWTLSTATFSRCTGGNAANRGDYQRATDPWVTISPNGVAYAMSLSFTGDTLAPGSSSAMLAARSSDGGRTWSAPVVLISDGEQFFNDKGSITADGGDSRFVYAVWDRLTRAQDGPAWFARTVDGGASWDPARSIYDAGPGNQTIGNQIVVLPGGAIVNVFTEIDVVNNIASSSLRAIRSDDRGDTWSDPVTIAEVLGVGAFDPETGAPVRDGSDLPALAVDGSGVIYTVWQDARFSGGQRDAVALSRSLDGGATWSAPLRVNPVATTQAFTPAVHVRADGVIGVSYYDFRNNTTSPDTLPTDYWLATSTDAQTFAETHLSGSFDLLLAPDAGGLFLGDYQTLASNGNSFLPFFVQTNSGTDNRTDVFIGDAQIASATQATSAKPALPATAPAVEMTAEWRQRIHDRIMRRRAAPVPD
jgi:hypothetical protein